MTNLILSLAYIKEYGVKKNKILLGLFSSDLSHKIGADVLSDLHLSNAHCHVISLHSPHTGNVTSVTNLSVFDRLVKATSVSCHFITWILPGISSR